MRRVLLGLLVLLLAGAGVLVAQGVHHSTTDTYDFLNGFQLNGGTRITGTTGSQNSAVVLPDNSVGGGEMSGVVFNVIFCGELAENGTTYLGPALAPLTGDATASYAIGSAGCDALDNTTEGTADAPLFALAAFKIMGMWCQTDGTLGAGETLVYTMRTAEADTVPAITCTISAGQQECRTLTGTTTDIAANATVAMKAVETSNNADDNGSCKVSIALK